MTGMIRNIVEGLHYIHNSRFVQHGILVSVKKFFSKITAFFQSAYRCMVGDRFEVKIQFFGLTGLKAKTFRRLDEHSALYVAPEHLHGQQNELGSQAGDIYSLGITCSVILTMKPAYGLEEEEDESDVVRAVAKGKYPPVRPSLNIDPSIEVNPELVSILMFKSINICTFRLHLSEKCGQNIHLKDRKLVTSEKSSSDAFLPHVLQI